MWMMNLESQSHSSDIDSTGELTCKAYVGALRIEDFCNVARVILSIKNMSMQMFWLISWVVSVCGRNYQIVVFSWSEMFEVRRIGNCWLGHLVC